MIESEKSKFFMTTTTTIKKQLLFPPLTEVSSTLLSDEKYSQQISCPSIASFLLLEQHQQKNDDKKRTIIHKPSGTKQQTPRLTNYDQIKDILLSISTKNCNIHSNSQKTKTDTLDEWCIHELSRQKVNKKYLQSKFSAERTLNNPSTTPLEILSINRAKVNPLPTILPSKFAVDSHYTDWQLHLLNYKQNKGHYLTFKELTRLLDINTLIENRLLNETNKISIETNILTNTDNLITGNSVYNYSDIIRLDDEYQNGKAIFIVRLKFFV
jgi:hypothetical protein